jgi:hypothetical protein
MIYRIIEDCSPYYVRFTYDGIDEFIRYATEVYDSNNYTAYTGYILKFAHCRLDSTLGRQVLAKIPLSSEIQFNDKRVSFFKSCPGLYYRAHKDGLDHRFSINYTIKILDDKCVTSWYSDDAQKGYQLDYLNGRSRELVGFVKDNHTPVKTMIASPNECILFNTDIYHDWDNSNSFNERIVLTLRTTTPGSIYFDDIKQILYRE